MRRFSFTRSLMSALRYLFHPNPGRAAYDDTMIIAVLTLCGCLIVAALLLRPWRHRLRNPMTRRLSRSWSSASLWFGVAGAVLMVARVEGIQFIAMRFLWVLWIVGVLLYLVFQVRQFTQRHYEVVPQARVEDPLQKYLPTKKKR